MKRKNVKRLVRGGRTGRRIYGGIYEIPDGREVYLAWRNQDEIFRSGEKVLSDSIANGKACWAIDDDTLINLRIEGVPLVGVLVKDTGDIYITTRDVFQKSKVMNYESRGGALQRYLPLANFAVLHGNVRVK